MENKGILTTKALAIIGFILAIIYTNLFNVWTMLIFIALFVIAALVCKDKNGTADVLNAGMLYLLNCLIIFIFDSLREIVNFFLYCADQPSNPKALEIIFDILLFIVGVAIVVLALLSIFNLLMKKPSKTIGISIFTNKILDIAPIKAGTQGANAQASTQGTNAQQAWTCASCGIQSAGEFCPACGSKKPQ